ncbi:unnamed protein product [Darwinula stevensoni]|uniref:Uncharacterized protein n=1 Tax=Darwinula stevensoni TaxID=69355 RepID=A0A7R9FNK9_9CRUS|nr:unnamed protein product [Darwinula stevensoni]CAG0896920.1 unnamed protein product [Darwinula stevensoni]
MIGQRFRRVDGLSLNVLALSSQATSQVGLSWCTLRLLKLFARSAWTQRNVEARGSVLPSLEGHPSGIPAFKMPRSDVTGRWMMGENNIHRFARRHLSAISSLEDEKATHLAEQASLDEKELRPFSESDLSVTSQIEEDQSDTDVEDVPPVFRKPRTSEDLDLQSPPLPASFNLAPFVDKSETLQQLVKLGVDLHRIQTKGKGEELAKLDFEKHVAPLIRFLMDLEIETESLGYILSKNFYLLLEGLDTLEERVAYLRAKKFTNNEIGAIVTRTPLFLSLRVETLDERMGWLQKTFRLKGDEVRLVVVKHPRLIVQPMMRFKGLVFSLHEELGFSLPQMKELLLGVPKLFTISTKHLMDRFAFFHREVGMKHEDFLSWPQVLQARLSRTRPRHLFLVRLDRAQYDPKLPLYVCLKDLVVLDDATFCTDIAKTPVEIYNRFLKTL